MTSATMEKKQKTVTAQELWTSGGMDHSIRHEMLDTIGHSRSFASLSWKKLGHITKVNLESRTWTVKA